MASSRTSYLVPGLLLVAVILLGLAISWNNFFLLRVKPYSMPAGSMEPTLEVGDMFLVEQLSPAVGESKVPVRGDIVVFFLPGDPRIAYVKRLIGLPGDNLQMHEGKVILNGTPLTYDRIDDYVGENASGAKVSVQRYRETLPGGRVYEILDLTPDGMMDNTNTYSVPEGHVFVLGDNRDNSIDSRFKGQVGFVPIENVSGVAKDVYFSGAGEQFTWRSVVPSGKGASLER
ncbi:signal peptidase I [Roseibium sediminicola]|uniref:Signal peptidase I n=1 Tax=Roseibium sediminicola TaxID=2933272 RepID=A0ABT0GR22_9HYPH|nr:signal peptidase I [Roseibium sp. CAU 1639]MCK7611872.1 signal peptidase I [Roseibium sp. CAU 1639]